jgi:CAAX prenyl protease-like protein
MTEAAEKLEGHGWWPYLGPYAGFLIIVQINSWLPDAWQPAMLFVKPAVPAALILYFAIKRCYPELESIKFQPGWWLVDILVGVLLAVQWMAPYFLIDALPRPEAVDGFDPWMAGEAAVGTIIALRFFGYALVTPIFEELFIRSFVLRVSAVYAKRGDFRRVPLAHYTLTSFISTSIIFTVGHAPWEWWVAVPWVVLTNLWFYYRKDMGSTILVHATTNATILIYVCVATELVPGGALWVFV